METTQFAPRLFFLPFLDALCVEGKAVGGGVAGGNGGV